MPTAFPLPLPHPSRTPARGSAAPSPGLAARSRLQLLPPPGDAARRAELNQELLRCCFFGYLERMIEALAAGADPNGASAQGNRPLHLLVCARRPELMGPLLRAGADPALPGASGFNALDLARHTGQDLALRYLTSAVVPPRSLPVAA